MSVPSLPKSISCALGRCLVSLPWPLQIALTTAVMGVALLGAYLLTRDSQDPPMLRAAFTAVLALILSFPWMVWLRIVRHPTPRLAAGEILGLTLAGFLVLVFLTDLCVTQWLTPDGELNLLLLYGTFPALVGVFFGSIVLLLWTIVGGRRHVAPKLTESLGLVLVVAFGVLVFIDLRLHPLCL